MMIQTNETNPQPINTTPITPNQINESNPIPPNKRKTKKGTIRINQEKSKLQELNERTARLIKRNRERKAVTVYLTLDEYEEVVTYSEQYSAKVSVVIRAALDAGLEQLVRFGTGNIFAKGLRSPLSKKDPLGTTGLTNPVLIRRESPQQLPVDEDQEDALFASLANRKAIFGLPGSPNIPERPDEGLVESTFDPFEQGVEREDYKDDA